MLSVSFNLGAANIFTCLCFNVYVMYVYVLHVIFMLFICFYFQLSRTLKSGSTKSTGSQAVFEPLAELKTEGMVLEILVRGLLFLDVQFGITSAVVAAIGQCACGSQQADCDEVSGSSSKLLPHVSS